MLFFLFFLSFIFFSSIADEVGERGGVAGGVGQAVTAVHSCLNRKEEFFCLHVILIECFSLSGCWLLDLNMY